MDGKQGSGGVGNGKGESNAPKPKENVAGSDDGVVMKAPGGDGSYISRDEFEKNPQGYFAGLHAQQKENK
ncbi:hypothetical protein SESBI_43813 [Sesbania bispinosa]|nr:hypothetical protein SESBI_43813 [Sesbania bispinosa]